MTEPVPVSLGRPPATTERPARIRRGRLLAWFTIAWNSVEGIVGIASGLAAGSIALVGFGVDSARAAMGGRRR